MLITVTVCIHVPRYVVTVPVCPVMEVPNAFANTSGCLKLDRCQVGTILVYFCTGNSVISTSVAVCTENHSWSHQHVCLNKDGIFVLHVLTRFSKHRIFSFINELFIRKHVFSLRTMEIFLHSLTCMQNIYSHKYLEVIILYINI